MVLSEQHVPNVRREEGGVMRKGRKKAGCNRGIEGRLHWKLSANRRIDE